MGGRQLTPLHDPRMESAAWPGTEATELWDVCSHVFTETMHRTYVYKASDLSAAASRLRVCPPGSRLGDTCTEEPSDVCQLAAASPCDPSP